MLVNVIWLKISTGRRQTSWLCTRVAEELNSGLPRTNPASGQSGNWTANSRCQVRRPNRSDTLLPPSIPSSPRPPSAAFCVLLQLGPLSISPFPIQFIHAFVTVNLVLYLVFLECNQADCLLARAPHSCCWTGTRAKCWRHRVCVNWLFCQVRINSMKSSWKLERHPPLTTVVAVLLIATHILSKLPPSSPGYCPWVVCMGKTSFSDGAWLRAGVMV